jgi:hypothetical protein
MNNIDHAIDGAGIHTKQASHQFVGVNQDKVPGRYIAAPVPVGMLAAASTRDVRREADSYPAREVDNEKNEQKGPENAATNIHLILH